MAHLAPLGARQVVGAVVVVELWLDVTLWTDTLVSTSTALVSVLFASDVVALSLFFVRFAPAAGSAPWAPESKAPVTFVASSSRSMPSSRRRLVRTPATHLDHAARYATKHQLVWSSEMLSTVTPTSGELNLPVFV